MIHQRKRFNYLGVHQRSLNSSQVTEVEKLLKSGCIVSSNTKKQALITSQYQANNFSRNSSAQKYPQPLSQIHTNIPSINSKKSNTKLFNSSDKENLNQLLLNPSFSSKKQSSQHLHQKIRQLEQQNYEILKQTEQKFLIMEMHLQKVQRILKEKQSLIETLSEDNKFLAQQNEEEQSLRMKAQDEKQELLRIIGDKNRIIENLQNQIEEFTLIQANLLSKIDTLSHQNNYLQQQSAKIAQKMNVSFEEVQIQTQIQQLQQISIISQKQTIQAIQQTDFSAAQIQHLLASKTHQEMSLNNFKHKYDSLFKKALQMEDELYQLKQQLFDSQSQTKTIKQEFNTYKLLYHIHQIKQKTETNSED